MKVILYIWALLIAISIGLTAKQAMAQPIVTESTSNSKTKVESPPPSAISPSITTINNKMCSSGVAAAVQTQIFGISMGSTIKDSNCELVLLSETLFNMQMKTAAVSLMCQDNRVFWGMWDAGTYCPIQGKVGLEAKVLWEQDPSKMPSKP
jgi:hypothetical protein